MYHKMMTAAIDFLERGKAVDAEERLAIQEEPIGEPIGAHGETGIPVEHLGLRPGLVEEHTAIERKARKKGPWAPR